MGSLLKSPYGRFVDIVFFMKMDRIGMLKSGSIRQFIANPGSREPADEGERGMGCPNDLGKRRLER
jgi:hypothetical protein